MHGSLKTSFERALLFAAAALVSQVRYWHLADQFSRRSDVGF